MKLQVKFFQYNGGYQKLILSHSVINNIGLRHLDRSNNKIDLLEKA